MKGTLHASAAALVLGLGGIGGMPDAAWAEEPPAEDAAVTELSPVTATALRMVRSLFETPANVSVITRPEIERRMYETIEDMVRYEPGVFVTRQTSRTDPFSSLGGFTIRGVSGNRVLTIVDGSRVIERITDQTRDLVELGHMKRIEIVRGPASVLWGSDALGGVVAFTTKDPADYLKPAGRDAAFQGDFFYSSANNAFTEIGTGAVRMGPFEALLSYTRYDANEFTLSKARATGGVWSCPRAPESLPCNKLDPSDIGANTVLAKLVYNVDRYQWFKLTGEYFHRGTDVDQLWDHGRAVNADGSLSTTTETLDYRRRQDLQRYRLALEHSWQTNLSFLDSFRWQITYHPQRLERTGDRYQRSLTSGVVTYRRDELRYSEDFYEAEAQFRSSLALGPTHHEFTYGLYGSLAQTRYDAKNFTRVLPSGAVTTSTAGFNFADADTTRADVYLQDEIALFGRRVLITPGFRYATYRINPRLRPGYLVVPGSEPRELFADDLSIRIGAVVKVTEHIALYGQYSEGFKMPTAEQLFTSVPSPPFFNLVPNPNLRPERVKSYEIGIRGQFRDVFVSTNVFYARYRDFIQSFVEIPGTIDITYQNLTRVAFWGVEGSGVWRFHPNWELTGAFMWQRAEQKADDVSSLEPFNGAEPYRIVAGLRWRKPEWGLDAEVIGSYFGAVTASRTDDTPTERFRPDAAFVVDANLAWSPRPWITLRASVLNLFDKRYFPASVAGTHAAYPESASVAATNNIELQTAPGRTFRVGLTVRF